MIIAQPFVQLTELRAVGIGKQLDPFHTLIRKDPYRFAFEIARDARAALRFRDVYVFPRRFARGSMDGNEHETDELFGFKRADAHAVIGRKPTLEIFLRPKNSALERESRFG